VVEYLRVFEHVGFFVCRGRGAICVRHAARKDLMTSANERTLVGIFESRHEAELVVDELYQAGFGSKDIGFAIRGDDAVAGGEITDAPLTRDGQGAVKGMVAGGLAGGLLGAAAVLVIPGVGPLLAMGVLASVLGFGAAGVATGGILGAMVGLGISEEEARAYEKEFNAGRAIVTVHAGLRAQEARDILGRHGAHNIQNEPTDPLHPVSAV
jgi:hypothetical protein